MFEAAYENQLVRKDEINAFVQQRAMKLKIQLRDAPLMNRAKQS